MSKVFSAVLSPVASVFGYKSGNKAVNTATSQQINANKDAQAALNPYMESGTQANTRLQNALSTGELGGTFKPRDLTQDPGYQFDLQEGEKALGRKQSAAGNYFSGEALKEAQQYGQGLADRTYNDAYNRDILRQKNLYDILSGQQTQGRAAATNYGGYASDIGQYLAQGTIQKEQNKQKMINSLFNSLSGGF